MGSATVLEELNTIMQDAAKDDTWDRVPSLGLLFKDPDGEVVVWGFPMHAHHWSQGRVPDIINTIATAMESDEAPGMQVLQGASFVGTVLLNEGWTVSIEPESTPERYEEVMTEAAAHLLDLRPDKREVRILTAVDVDGWVYSGMHFRDEEPGTVRSEIDGLRSGGTLVENLSRLTQAMVSKIEYVEVLPEE